MTIGFASMCPRPARWGLYMLDFGFRVQQSPHGSAAARELSSASKHSDKIANSC
jgi:hypothetical protein